MRLLARQTPVPVAVADAYGTFAVGLARFKALQNTVGISAANLNELLNEHGLTVGPTAAWRTTARLAVEQLAADDRYHEARTREAEVTLRVLEAQAAVERTKVEAEENRLNERRNRLLTCLSLLVAAAAIVLAITTDDLVMGFLYEALSPEEKQQFVKDRLLGSDILRLKLKLAWATLLTLTNIGLAGAIGWEWFARWRDRTGNSSRADPSGQPDRR